VGKKNSRRTTWLSKNGARLALVLVTTAQKALNMRARSLIIRMPQKKPLGEEGDDPDYDPRVDVELQGPCVEPQEDPILGPNGDVEQQQLEVQ